MTEQFEVVIAPSFQAEIDSIKDKKQLELILKSIEKIKRMGKNCLKMLHVRNQYLLCEIKFKRPPYRLYVITNQEDGKFYIVRWAHKDDQEKVINEIKIKLENVFKMGIKNLSELFKR